MLMDRVAGALFDYLHDVIYRPENASLDVGALPDEFRDLGKGLAFFGSCVIEARALAQALSKGDLDVSVPSANNEIAAPLKSLHASLRHLTWQAQQIAKGDFQQRVDFMGDFSESFNVMAQQLEERQKQETQERSKLQRYINMILTSTPNYILAFDTDEKAVFASESYLERNGAITVDELQGKTFPELFSPISPTAFVDGVETLFHRVRTDKAMAVIEQDLDIGQDGNERTYLIHITPMFFENETFMGIMVIFDDMTEIARARKQAEHSARAKSDFLARMSHEMHTPMNAIIGMASIGKSSATAEKKDYSFRMIENASAHLLGVINDILDMSSIEAGKMELSFGECGFEDIISNVVSMAESLAEGKSQSFEADIDKGVPPRIIADEERLTQVIVNLLSNAVKFTPERGSVTLIVRKVMETEDSCTIRFTVKDDGIGISEEQQKQLFVPFEQIDGGSSRKFGGAGLGLAISKHIVGMMGGSIWVESEQGQGASFIFEIKAQIVAEQHDVSKQAKGGGKTSGIFSGRRILIAEDVEINREIIAALLEDTGVEISFAVNGQEAVEMLSSDPGRYELVLMDVQMPLMDGYEATERIRSSGFAGAGAIPIIAMTANATPEDVDHCLSIGMNGHLAKPVDIDGVIGKLGEHLGASAQ